MSFSQNRFDILLGDEETEVDKLGNVKPVEKKDKEQTRRDARKPGYQRQPAVSPPSKRDRRSNGRNESNITTEDVKPTREKKERPGQWTGRGRQFDRHSGTGIVDNEKKINQGWGKAGEAEFEGANDVLNPNDPGAAETPRTTRNEEPEENTKTLDQYLTEKKEAAQKFRLDQGRKANEGSDETQWKGSVVYEKEEAVFFVGNKETETKVKSKTKKEKVYLDIDQPSHRGGGDRRRNNNNRGGRRGNNPNQQQQRTVNLSDSNAFPTLGA